MPASHGPASAAGAHADSTAPDTSAWATGSSTSPHYQFLHHHHAFHRAHAHATCGIADVQAAQAERRQLLVGLGRKPPVRAMSRCRSKL